MRENLRILSYMNLNIRCICKVNLTSYIFAGLPPQHLYYSPPEGHTTTAHSPATAPSAHPKYHENGQVDHDDHDDHDDQDDHASNSLVPGQI